MDDVPYWVPSLVRTLLTWLLSWFPEDEEE